MPHGTFRRKEDVCYSYRPKQSYETSAFNTFYLSLSNFSQFLYFLCLPRTLHCNYLPIPFFVELILSSAPISSLLPSHLPSLLSAPSTAKTSFMFVYSFILSVYLPSYLPMYLHVLSSPDTKCFPRVKVKTNQGKV